ncbi:MAG: DUF3108 domain-containing protein [Bdellovibrionales bacterium]
MKNHLLALTLLAFLAPLNEARAATTDLTYDIAFWGLPIGTIHYRIVQEDNRYTLTFDGGFGGLVGLFADAGGKATTRGIIKNGRILPQRMEQDVQWGEKLRKVWIQFDDDGNVAEYGADPVYSPEGRAPVTASMLEDVLDSLSAMILTPPVFGKDFCDRTQRVFDGRERYDLQFSPTDTAMKCKITPTQLGGHKINDEDAENPPRPFKMTFTTIAGGQLAVPEKTIKPFTLGNATIKLVKVSTH